MTFKIGFLLNSEEEKEELKTEALIPPKVQKSVVEVYFPDRDRSYSYFNDRFELKVGSIVYVDGKLKGLRGKVTQINFNFKIDLSVYKRVISVVDTDVQGEFFIAGSHFISFDKNALPPQKALTWFEKPNYDDDEIETEIISDFDETSFSIDDLSKMKISHQEAEKGHELYLESRVLYISREGKNCFAIVESNDNFEKIEFCYDSGEISHLVCSCFSTGACRHEFAVILQLKELFDIISKKYPQKHENASCFYAVDRDEFISFVIADKTNGSILFK